MIALRLLATAGVYGSRWHVCTPAERGPDLLRDQNHLKWDVLAGLHGFTCHGWWLRDTGSQLIGVHSMGSGCRVQSAGATAASGYNHQWSFPGKC